MHPFFAWLKDSKSHGACNVNMQAGVSWRSHLSGVVLVLCFGSNQSPLDLYVEDRTSHTVERNRLVTFEFFKPGKPADSNYVVPSICPK